MSDTPHTISEKTAIKLPVGIWVLVIISAAGFFANIAISQNQISAHERRLEKLENDRELLLRIDERTSEIKRQLDRISP